MVCQSSLPGWNGREARASTIEPVGRWRTSTSLYLAVPRSITDIFVLNHRCYGYRRLQASLTRQCVTISEKVVQRLMKRESLVISKPKQRRYGSYLGNISPAPKNLINRDFQAATPNEKWLTDITEFQIPAGKVYLSPIIDCFDGLVISWSIGEHPNAELVNSMLDAAIETVADGSARPIVTLTVEAIIAGLVGYRGSVRRSWCARCLARATRLTTLHAKGSPAA